MSEFLIDKEKSINFQNDDLSGFKPDLFEFDRISDTLKHIHSNSRIRNNLSRVLSKFYSYPILIIIFSFLIGLLFFGVPMLFIFFQVFENIIKPIIFIILISLFFSISIIIIRIIDDKKHKFNIGAKWERKNILKNIGLSLTLIILTIESFLFHSFFNDIINYKKKNELDLIYENNNIIQYNNNIYDFIMRYIINCFLVDENEIKNKNFEVNNIIEKLVLNKLHNSLVIACIPFIIFCTNKIIKIMIIEVKYTIPQLIVFLNSFFLCSFIFILHFFYDDKNIKWHIISLIELIVIILIFLGYIFWIINAIYKLYKNPKDKNFAINKYDFCHISIILFFDLLNFIGTSLMIISIIISFTNYVNEYETYKDLINIIFLLKFGFLLCVISNSYYYGHHLLSLIFRPISLQYAPVKLKRYYIIANKNMNIFFY